VPERRFFILIFTACLLLQTVASSAEHGREYLVASALYRGQSGDESVALPHLVPNQDLSAAGSFVSYTLSVELDHEPGEIYAIYVPKISLSGDLVLNGVPLGACAPGLLVGMRCLHQPSFWFPDQAVWRAGVNDITIRVWGDRRQMVGLSQVTVAPARTIFASYYRPYIIRLQMTYGLIWASGILGLVALVMAPKLPREPVFFYFGLAAIANSLASVNSTIIHIPVSQELFSWFIFSSRYIANTLLLLTILSAYGLLTRLQWLEYILWAKVMIAPVTIWMSGNSREVVLALYIPLFLLGLYVVAACTLQTLRSRDRFQISLLVGITSLAIASLFDMLRLSGVGTFTGTYVFGYVFSTILIIFGWIIFLRFVEGVRLSQGFTEKLEAEVATRTDELSRALDTIRNLETSALRLTENIPVGTFVLREGGSGSMSFQFFSKRLRQMFGLPADGPPPDTAEFLERIATDNRGTFVEAVNASLQSGNEFCWEGATVAEIGARWLGIRALPDTKAREHRSWAGVCTDLTEVRRAEIRLKDANSALLERAVNESRERERERLMQEIHDGFGSQLVSARLAAQSKGMTLSEVCRILDECATDLHLVVDAIGNADGNFADMLTDFRDRTLNRLIGTGIILDWDIDMTEAGPGLPATTGLRVLRILQEALSNALRHSGGTRLRITVRSECADGVDILTAHVEDDGRGLSDKAKPRRGMSNMIRRAREAGATLEFANLDPGLRVDLRLEITRHG
jgi:signal transduction histidine kinase